jgi:diphthamide biosynthesis protein 3
MTSFYDEIEIEDMEFDEGNDLYFYPCPCGDRFEITRVSSYFYKYSNSY